MTTDPRPVLTDPDQHVTIHLTETDAITVAVSVAALQLPPEKLARLIVKVGERLPRPDAERHTAASSSLDAMADLNQTLAEGGWTAFDKAMRARLGLSPAASPLASEPETDAALANTLGKVIRGAQAAASASEGQAESADPPAYQAVSSEEDLAASASTEYPIASVWIGPNARERGAEGFGEALTEVIAQARAGLKDHLETQAREELPAAVFDGMESVPGQAERAERAGMSIIDQANRMVEQLKQKAGKA